MWTRADLKMRGKLDFSKNYWVCVLISLILVILSGQVGSAISGIRNGFTASTSATTEYNYDGLDETDEFDGYYQYGDTEETNPAQIVKNIFTSSMGTALVVMSIGIALLLSLIGTLFSIFVAAPLIVGGRRFYLENQYENSKISRIGYIFKKKYYGNTVLTIFLRDLFTFLWSLLFIIPGVIKSYSYWMMEYIMAENPTLSHERAFEISKQTMVGEKWDVFVLDLSFIPWHLLSTITCGLVGIFYVNSYVDATYAQLYGFLRMKALNQGFATPEELPGYYPQNGN